MPISNEKGSTPLPIPPFTPTQEAAVNQMRKQQQQKKRKRIGPIATSTRQIAGYFTVSGIENEISLPERDWPKFSLKELSDNSFDWLNDFYPVTSADTLITSRAKRQIAIRIQIEQIPKDPDLTRVFRIAVRNSNVNYAADRGNDQDIFSSVSSGSVRKGLEQIFNYNQWFSTKRYQHRMTTGSMGDYLKRHAGMGYASWNNIARSVGSIENFTSDDDNEEDDNIQWEEPIIFRFNGSEYKVYVYYDRYKGIPDINIKYAGKSDAIDYTEVECALPVTRVNCNGLNDNDPVSLFDKLYAYYKQYKVPKANIKFSFDMRYEMHHIHEEEETRYIHEEEEGEGRGEQ